jgi:hypothetical protein
VGWLRTHDTVRAAVPGRAAGMCTPIRRRRYEKSTRAWPRGDRGGRPCCRRSGAPVLAPSPPAATAAGYPASRARVAACGGRRAPMARSGPLVKTSPPGRLQFPMAKVGGVDRARQKLCGHWSVVVSAGFVTAPSLGGARSCAAGRYSTCYCWQEYKDYRP